MSFRTNPAYTALLATLRDRASELTSQTLALRGRAAAGVAGGVALGALTLGSAVGAVASADPSTGASGATGAVAGAAVAGKNGQGTVRSEGLAEKAGSTAQNAEAARSEPGKGNNKGESARAAKSAKSASARQVLKLAEKQVGISEGSGGQTKFHDWYVKSEAAKLTAARDGGSVSSYNGAQWCNMFVSWLGAQTGVKGMGADAYTVAHAKWFEKTGRWGQKAKPGAVVFFAWNGGGIEGIEHVGLVVKDNGDGTIDTIEGNTSNKVMKKTRDKATVAGYGYPDYRG
ncbi:CHAP domain-containing protein [Spirillospora sp. CA-255316]